MSRRSKRVIAFSKATIEGLIPPLNGRVEFWDENTPSLSCRVTPTGVKSFYWVGRSSGKWSRTLIGQWPMVNVAGARTEAARLSGEAAQGKQPIARRRLHKGEWTLQQLYDWYMENLSKPFKRTWRRDERQWRTHFKQWANRPVSSITRLEVQELHLKIGDALGPYAGNKVLEMLGHMFRQGRLADPLAVPCEDPTKGIKRFPRQERERFLDSDELPKFIEAVGKLQREVSRDFIMLSLWTGARRANLCSMRWDEISLSSGMWIIPKEKSKNKRPMNIVLSELAIEILKRRKANAEGPWVLPGQGKSGHYVEPKAAMQQVLAYAGLKDVRVHDLRRTLGSWMAIDNPLQVVGKQLGHSSVKSTAIYARLANKTVRTAVSNTTAAMNAKPKK